METIEDLRSRKETLKSNILDVIQKEYSSKEKKDTAKENLTKWRNELTQVNDKIEEYQSMQRAVSTATFSDNKTKLYNANETMYNPSNDDISLQNYLRAVTDKPKNNAEKQAIQNSVTSDGFELPSSVSSQLVDQLRAKNPVISAGAQTVQLESSETNYITINDDFGYSWHTELTEEDPNSGSFGKVAMKPKTVMSYVPVSRELLQDSANSGEALSVALTNSLSDAILEATFTGTGNDQPTGMNSLVSQTETYSGSVSHAELVKASTQLHQNNVDEGNRSFLYSPDVWETLSLATDSNGRYQNYPESIADVPKFTSSGVPTGTGYAGDFTKFLYGFRMNIQLEQHSIPKKFGQVWLAFCRMDIAVLNKNAFVRVEQA